MTPDLPHSASVITAAGEYAVTLRCTCGWEHEWMTPVPLGWLIARESRHRADVLAEVQS